MPYITIYDHKMTRRAFFPMHLEYILFAHIYVRFQIHTLGLPLALPLALDSQRARGDNRPWPRPWPREWRTVMYLLNKAGGRGRQLLSRP
jgi:hypothetical protein